MKKHAAEMVFPIGKPNEDYAEYFSGRSFIAPVSTLITTTHLIC